MTNTTWKWQTEDGLSVHTSGPTDSRGIRLRMSCGYTHVKMGDREGWLQIARALRKVDLAERLSAILSAA